MTAHHSPSTTPDDSATPTGDTVADTPTPVSVWWVDDRNTDDDTVDSRDSDTDTSPDDTAFVSRLTRRLVLTYTRRGEDIIDLDGDRHLRDAAADCGRGYVAVTDVAALADLDQLHHPSMIALCWPRALDTTSAASVRDLFLACGLIMNTGLCVIAITSTPQDGDQAAPAPLEVLLPAARSAGFRHELTIVAVSRPGDGDRFLFYASPEEATAVIAHPGDTNRPAIMIDLFTPGTHTSRDD